MKRLVIVGMVVLIAVLAALPAVARVADQSAPVGTPSFSTSAQTQYKQFSEKKCAKLEKAIDNAKKEKKKAKLIKKYNKGNCSRFE
ncbi:MAG: hypothetical protein M3Q49_22145 [Actinomycetota bacterium]|nr:hypothetical protein [Actinomycetota bacterium]